MEEDDFFDLERTKKIASQAARWDIYAKISPPFFLVSAVILVIFDLIEFDTLFYVGIVMFGLTAVVWWFWSIFTIRYIIRNMAGATQDLKEVKKEIMEITSEVRDLKNDQ